jgi:electron transport complex protein RnfB
MTALPIFAATPDIPVPALPNRPHTARAGTDHPVPDATLADRIDAVLPQTQCTQCGFDGCRPYAEAIAAGDVGIDRCPPGGDAGIVRLAALLHRPVVPLDTRCGQHKARHVAVIDERHCIGCTLCIQACPVDAIVGASKFMHVVLPDACSGCELCVAPCPVDCIVMTPARPWGQDDADQARVRHRQRNARLTREARPERAPAASDGAAPLADAPDSAALTADTAKRDTIAAALARARARRAGASAT